VDTRWLNERLESLPPEIESEETAALRYILEAWNEALSEGIGPRAVANAALFAAVSELVETYGERAVVSMAEGLKARVERGEFTLKRPLQ
jgi:hypothetical protein